MNQEYDVFMGSKAVGSARLEKQGLYWKIRCSCLLSGEVTHKVLVRSGEQEIDLGILVPEGERFVLTTRVAMKHLPQEPTFSVKPRRPKPQTVFQPIVPDEPFGYIEELSQAYLETKGNQVGIVIIQEDEEPGIPGSDPNP